MLHPEKQKYVQNQTVNWCNKNLLNTINRTLHDMFDYRPRQCLLTAGERFKRGTLRFAHRDPQFKSVALP
jgi:hypothetical protein